MAVEQHLERTSLAPLLRDQNIYELDQTVHSLVPLNTQIISPALADTFLIPYLAFEETAVPEPPRAQQLIEYAVPRGPNSRGEPQGFVRYQEPPERLFRQPSTGTFQLEGALAGRGQSNGVTRTPFAERLPGSAAQHLSSARDTGHPGRPLPGIRRYC